MDELKERLRISEIRAEQFQKETDVLQSRLEDALQEQVKLEDRLHEETERMEILENEKRDSARQMREMESIYEAERIAMTKEKEEMANREDEMQAIIQRLKESLNQKANGDDDGRIESRGFRHCMCPLPFCPFIP
jgi:chromosome segregation ATPase